MPTPPYAKLRVQLDSGAGFTAPASGGVVAVLGDVARLSMESSVGVYSQRWEIYDYPQGFAVPAGWTEGPDHIYFSTATTPPDFSLPAIPALWGKLLLRLIVNGADGRGVVPDAQLVDEATGISIPSATGVLDTAFGETNQFNTAGQLARDWMESVKYNWRKIEILLAGAALTAPVDPGENNRIAYALNGDLSYALVKTDGTTKLYFDKTVATPRIEVESQTAGAGVAFVISGQNAGGANNPGGDLRLRSGSAGTGNANGGVVQALLGAGVGTGANRWFEVTNDVEGSTLFRVGQLSADFGSAGDKVAYVDSSTGPSTQLRYKFLTDINIAPGAAIDGTKIDPDFGAQNIETTGNLILGSPPAATGRVRIANTGAINWRNAANSGDVLGLTVNASNQVLLGPTNGVLVSTTGATGIGRAPVAGIALSVEAAAVASTAETIARFTVSDDATSKIEIGNGDTTNGVMVPRFLMLASGALGTQYVSQATTDSGGVPVVAFGAQTAALGAIATRPTFAWFNLSTEQMSLSAAGLLKIPSLSASSGVYTDASDNLTSTIPTTGTLGYWFSGGGVLSPAPAVTGIHVGSSYLRFGTVAATTGQVRLEPLHTIEFRNVGDSANIVGLTLDSSNRVAIADSLMTLNPASGLVGIGTLAPSTQLDVVGQVGNHRYSASATTAPGFVGFRARGTEGAESPVLSGDRLVRVDGSGWDTASAYGSGGTIRLDATENFTGTAHGARWILATVANGTTSLLDRLIVDQNGNVGIGAVPGAFKLDVLGGVIGSTLPTRLIHTDTTNAGSHASHLISTGGPSGGDPFILWTVASTTTFYAGIDNSDSDKFMIGLNGVVGTTPYITVTTAGDVGIGTTTPSEKLQLAGTNADLSWSATSAGLQSTRYDATTSGVFNQRRALGTLASPAGVVAGSLLGQLGFAGYHSGGAFGVAMAAVRAHAAETFTSTAQGTNLRFLYAPTGTVTLTEGARLSEAGNFGVGGTPASTCRLDVLGGVAGTELCSRVFHSDNTNAASHAREWLVSGGASGGDPNIAFTVTGVTDWSIGIDNSDSDKLVVSRSLTVGTNPAIVIDTANFVGIATTTPLAALHVSTTTLTAYRQTSTAAGVITSEYRSTATGATTNYHRDSFFLQNSAAAAFAAAHVDARLSVITAAAEEGEWSVLTANAGAAAAARIMVRGNRLGFFGVTPVVRPAAYTRNATVVESRTLLASASATVTNCNNVLAALIIDLQGLGLLG